MYIYYISFVFYSQAKRCKIIYRDQITIEPDCEQVFVEQIRNAFINELKEEMNKHQATKFYIRKSGIVPII